MSKDPSTKVGAVLVGPNKELRGAGFNGLPIGVADLAERYHDRETKLEMIVHAEMNAIVLAGRNGIATLGCTLYVMGFGADGICFSGPPCCRCAVHAIQAGVVACVAADIDVPERWRASTDRSMILMAEAGVEYRRVRL